MRQHLQLVEVASAEAVSLLVFPELSLTGYELAASARQAFELDDPRLRPLVAAARVHDMTLVVGAPLRAPTGLHIAAFVVAPSGDVQVYTKHHLGAFRPEDHPGGAVPPSEHAFFEAGTVNPIIAWRGHRLALSICADSAYPDHAQRAAERGASLYLSCQFAIAAHMAFKMSWLKEAARRHALTVVFANYGGPTGGLEAAGGSCVRSADGNAVVRLCEKGVGLAIGWEDATGWHGKTLLC